MSLFSTIQQAGNALKVNELGLHVVGNNIANANTPGYIRQELVQSPAAAIKFGDVILGFGVQALGVVQKLDAFTVERLRQADSDLSSSQVLESQYSQIEALFGELTDNDLSSQLSEFSASIQDVLNEPGNEALRRLVIERGKAVSTNIRTLANQLGSIGGQLNQEVRDSATEINRLTQKIAELNQRIVTIEGGRTSGSDAVGLRDERITTLQELAKIVDIKAVEQSTGTVTVFVGGEYLVADAIHRPVTAAVREEEGGPGTLVEVRLVDTESPLQVSSGRLHGLYAARDGILNQVGDRLDGFARDLIDQFNIIHSQGQAIQGFSEVIGSYAADDPNGALDLAGFDLGLTNGEFEIKVFDLGTQQEKTFSIRVQLTGGPDDTSLEDVRSAIDAISGLSADISSDGQLSIDTTSNSLRFTFQNDTSNFLAAAGINTFFVGNSASTIDLNDVIKADHNMFAASLTGPGTGTDNALRLAEAFDRPLAGLNGKSLKQSFEDVVVTTTQDIDLQRGVSEGLQNLYRTLEGQHLAASGVNLDEEAVKMIFYQRAFQASSRLIQASSEMLEVLVNL